MNKIVNYAAKLRLFFEIEEKLKKKIRVDALKLVIILSMSSKNEFQ
ncbi:MAG: hypothetical protein LBI60_03430 [Bacteroidales bacterium]|nr:hypothetical protein [Bacteroidales bacterium]